MASYTKQQQTKRYHVALVPTLRYTHTHTDTRNLLQTSYLTGAKGGEATEVVKREKNKIRQPPCRRAHGNTCFGGYVTTTAGH